MRFKCKYYGDKRVVKRFALFPIFVPVEYGRPLSTRKEVVWLETVYLVQYVECGQFCKEWTTCRFATREEYLEYKKKKEEPNGKT